MQKNSHDGAHCHVLSIKVVVLQNFSLPTGYKNDLKASTCILKVKATLIQHLQQK